MNSFLEHLRVITSRLECICFAIGIVILCAQPKEASLAQRVQLDKSFITVFISFKIESCQS